MLPTVFSIMKLMRSALVSLLGMRSVLPALAHTVPSSATVRPVSASRASWRVVAALKACATAATSTAVFGLDALGALVFGAELPATWQRLQVIVSATVQSNA